MRRLLIAAALLGAVQTAQAADMPEFPALRRWYDRLCERPPYRQHISGNPIT